MGDSEDSHSNASSGSGGGGGICGAIGCAVIGFLMIIGGTGLHYWNESNFVEVTELLSHAEDTGVEVGLTTNLAADKIANKLIHVTTPIITKDKVLKDAKFSVEDSCVRLKRVVEMYQWKETSTTEGKKKNKKTVYSYNEVWSSSAISSANFNKVSGYQNPSMTLKGETWVTEVSVNISTTPASFFKLDNDAFRSQITWTNPNSKTASTVKLLDNNKKQIADNASRGTKIGDYKIQWTCEGADGDEISAMGLYDTANKVLTKYNTELRILWKSFTSKDLNLLTKGATSMAEMIQTERDSNSLWTWIKRLGITVMIVAGSVFFWGPLSHCFDMIPCVGDCLSGMIDIFAGILGFLWALFVICICWVIVRPWIILWFLIAVGITVGIFVAVKVMRKGKGEEKTEEVEMS